MNLEGFKKVDSVNFIGKDVADITITKDSRFRFSPFAFSELGLKDNSLDERVDEATGDIALVTMPANTGRFYRKTEGKKKQRLVKNETLLQHLRAAGITGNQLSLENVGAVGTSTFFKISAMKVEAVDASAETAEQTA